MLHDGIKESTSPYSNPIMVVPMPDGSIWLCNNFWELNVVPEVSGYLMLQVDELIV